jgi:hypothetical protein
MSSKYLEKQTAKDLSFVPLLYQTGYLTRALPVENNIYTLKIPNSEVRESFDYLNTEAFIGEKLGDFFQFGLNLLEGFQKNNADILQNCLTDLILSLSLLPQDLHERTIHLAILVFLKLAGINKGDIFSEPKIDGGRPDIAFKLDDRGSVLLELKVFKIPPNKTASDLETQCVKSLDEAEEQMEKYYNPLFAKTKVAEIQGIAIAVAWGARSQG